MKKVKKFVTIAVALTMCAGVATAFSACGHTHTAAENAEWVSTDDTYHWKPCQDDDDGQPEKAEHSYDSSADSTCNVCGHKREVVADVTATTVVNDTVEAVEECLANMCGATSATQAATTITPSSGSAASSYAATFSLPQPGSDNYTTKAEAAQEVLTDIVGLVYEIKYMVNYLYKSYGYSTDFTLGQVYTAYYDVYNAYIPLCISQEDDGIIFIQQISAEQTYEGVTYTREQETRFEFVYNYNTKTPEHMRYYYRSYESSGDAATVMIGAADMDLTAKTVNYMSVGIPTKDEGAAVYSALDNESFNFDALESYGDDIEDGGFYMIASVSLDKESNDYYVYNYKLGQGSSEQQLAEIDDTLKTRYNAVYDSVKTLLHSGSDLDTTNAVKLDAEFYPNMGYYTSFIANTCMSVDSLGNIIIDTLTYEEIKTALTQIKNNYSTYVAALDSTCTYTEAEAALDSAIAYLNSINEAGWAGYFAADFTLKLDSGSGLMVDYWYIVDTSAGMWSSSDGWIEFTISAEGTATLLGVHADGDDGKIQYPTIIAQGNESSSSGVTIEGEGVTDDMKAELLSELPSRISIDYIYDYDNDGTGIGRISLGYSNETSSDLLCTYNTANNTLTIYDYTYSSYKTYFADLAAGTASSHVKYTCTATITSATVETVTVTNATITMQKTLEGGVTATLTYSYTVIITNS